MQNIGESIAAAAESATAAHAAYLNKALDRSARSSRLDMVTFTTRTRSMRAFALHSSDRNTWLPLMPQLEWNDIDLLDFFAVEPTAEDYDVSHNYEIERNGLRLLFTVWQFESVIQVSVFRSDSDDALFTFAAYIRAGTRFINDKRGRYLEIADCIIAPNRFWYIESGDPFDRERFPIAVTVTVAIDPDIRIGFVNCEPRT